MIRITRNKFLFYLLSFTWGLPLTLIGCIVGAILLITGHKPHKWGCCHYFNVGNNWGGVNLGIIFITDNSDNHYTKCHECGHAIQNCFFGFLMPFIVCAPSVIRYWYRELKYNRKGINPPTKYDAVWFESLATKLGINFMRLTNKNN